MMIDMGRAVVVFLGKLNDQHHATQVTISTTLQGEAYRPTPCHPSPHIPSPTMSRNGLCIQAFLRLVVGHVTQAKKENADNYGITRGKSPTMVVYSSWRSEPTGLWFEETKGTLTAFN
jgi:hypothetical protein